MKKITTSTPKTRIETGPIQIDGDWPGVFIRGDNAVQMAMYLQTILNNHKVDENDPIADAVMKGLISTLQSCDTRTHEIQNDKT